MLSEEWLKDKRQMRVTFELPNSLWVCSIALVGDFSDWNSQCHFRHQRRDGTWTVSVELAAGRSFTFHYLIEDLQ